MNSILNMKIDAENNKNKMQILNKQICAVCVYVSRAYVMYIHGISLN